MQRGAHFAHVENVLQHRDAHDQIEGPVDLQRRGVLHDEPASVREPAGLRSALGLRDHGGTQIDTGDGSAARCEQSAPAADATADIEDPHARGDLQPRLERAPLTDVDEPVVEAGHAVGADRGQAVAGDGKALRAGFPIVGGAVTGAVSAAGAVITSVSSLQGCGRRGAPAARSAPAHSGRDTVAGRSA